MRLAISLCGLVVFVVFIGALPLVLNISSGQITLQFELVWELIEHYIEGIFDGQAFIYQEGIDRHPNFFRDVPRNFLTSFLYLIVSGVLAVSFGLLIASWQGKSKKEWLKDIIGFFGMLPDFIFVLFLQLGTVFFFQTFGYRLARIATRGVDEHAILLPLITLTIVPTIYLIRSLAERTYDVLGEDYILMAKAKGQRKIYITIQHVIRNVLPYLKADLHKVVAMMISNLFIVEYLYNISGLTSLLFNNSTGYQFNLTVNTLFTLIILYIIFYWGIRLFILLLERIFAHD